MPTVLIVDDETNIRRMVGALLTSEGFEVREAADGLAGIARAEELEPDLMLLDLMIPGVVDGMGVLERLRGSCPEVPVIRRLSLFVSEPDTETDWPRPGSGREAPPATSSRVRLPERVSERFPLSE